MKVILCGLGLILLVLVLLEFDCVLYVVAEVVHVFHGVSFRESQGFDSSPASWAVFVGVYLAESFGVPDFSLVELAEVVPL